MLNVDSFACCLARAVPAQDYAGIRHAMDLSVASTAELLFYLAFYSGQRFPVLNTTLQQPAFERWDVPYWGMEASVASELDGLASAANRSVVPADLWRLSVRACAAERPDQGAFCAAIVSHNVLRTLGRYPGDVDSHGVDYAPTWFRRRQEYWVKRAPAIAASFAPLRRTGGSDEFGPWYHTFGLLVWAFNEVVRDGTAMGCLATELMAPLNDLYTQITGHPEDAEKARVDIDAGHLGCALTKLLDPAGAAPGAAGPPASCPVDCSSGSAYLLPEA